MLPQVIIEAAMFYQEEAETKNIKITLKDPRTQNAVTARPELIRQVLMNIFDNCAKYGRYGMPVLVDQRIQSSTGDALIEVRSTPQHQVSGDDLGRIFDLGFRGSNAKLMVASGTGLGLHICKQILDMYHGSLTVQIEHDSLLFTIKIPGGIKEIHRGR